MAHFEEDWDDRGLNDPYFDPTDNIPYGYEDEGIEEKYENDNYFFPSERSSKIRQNQDWYHQI